MRPDDIVVLGDQRGMRSLLALMGPASLVLKAAQTILSNEEPLLICTGFPVDGASETDGPVGAIVLARALRKLHRDFTIVSWAEALESWSPALGDLPTTAIPQGASPEPLTGAAITIEVCGRTVGNAYLNMRGIDISRNAPWFEDAIGVHALVSVGDGGNEYGMGSAPDAWFESRNIPKPVSTCDSLVLGQVSNWAVLAILAGMSRLTSHDLLPHADEYQELLEVLAERGVMDGVTKASEPTEDGFEVGRARAVIEELCEWLTGVE